MHGARIVIAPGLKRSTKYAGVDGFLTASPEQPLAILTADCVPVFLSADGGRVVGLLHAGWRGIQKRILPKAIRMIKRTWGIPASRVQAWTGPHIGPCCFEVQWDVAQYFPATRLRRGCGGRARQSSRTGGGQAHWTVDLAGELRRQAKQLGVRWRVPQSLGGGEARKRGFEGCTMHQPRFYSYRRDKTPKRQVSVIMKVAARHPGLS